MLRGSKLNSFQKERLITLSSGEIELKDDKLWFKINRMRVCTVDEDGVVCRLTFAQDQSGNDIRTNFLDKLDQLNLIIQNPSDIPESVYFLRGNCSNAMFFHDGRVFHYNFNLVTADNRNKATGAYCGHINEAEAKKKFDNLVRLFTDSDQQRKRVVVWFMPTLNTIDSIWDKNKPSVTDDYSTDPSSYKRA